MSNNDAPPPLLYAITEGSYSDYRIMALCSTRSAAEDFVKTYGGSIEEFPDGGYYLSRGLKFFCVVISPAGAVIECRSADPGDNNWHFIRDDELYTTVLATDEAHACKIARTEVLALNAWEIRGSLSQFSWAKSSSTTD